MAWIPLRPSNYKQVAPLVRTGGSRHTGLAALPHRNIQESGLSRKEWCQQNEIPQSTLGYWIRKIQSEAPETECISDPVFAKLPSEQELQFNAPAGTPPVTILLPENIRIEVGADCPSRLMTALLQALKNYA